MATWFLGGDELHNFDTCAVWIVGVQAVFTVTADLWAVKALQAVQVKLPCGSMNVFNAESEMILHPKFLVVGIGRNVEHVFNPVGAVRNVEFVPVNAVVLESAVPVEAKTKNLHVKTILSGHVFDHETCMEQMRPDLLGFRHVCHLRRRFLDENNGVPLRIADSEILYAIGIFVNSAGQLIVGKQVE